MKKILPIVGFHERVMPQNLKIETIKKQTLVTLLLIFFVFTVSSSYSQTSGEWTQLSENKGITVYYQIAAGSSEPVLIDPMNLQIPETGHETFRLKIVNANENAKSVTFSKKTKTDGNNELTTLEVNPGTTVLESYEEAPKLILTKIAGDQYPVSISDFLTAFVFTIND